MAKRRMMVQIIPRVIFRLPSTISKRRGREGGERERGREREREREREVSMYTSAKHLFGLRTKLSINTSWKHQQQGLEKYPPKA